MPRAVLLSFGNKPLVPDDERPVAFVAPIWSYLEDEGGLRLLVDALTHDVVATDEEHAKPKRLVSAKRAPRDRTLGLLHQELANHIQSAKAALRDGRPLLPRPEQQLLAKLAR